ncbi:MAG: Ig-like domain-containing protein, partial [Spirochaetaceae bacterium]|nr:Ig-like domain-containing protein [Spirochaetaceae bacterium]
GTTTRGHEFSAGPFVFVTDATAPELGISSPENGKLFSQSIDITGSVVDAGGPVELTWRALPDGERNEIGTSDDGAVTASLSAADFPAGSVVLEIEATDLARNVSRAYLCLGPDAELPELRFLSPEPGSAVWGTEGVAAIMTDASGIASVEFSLDGEIFAPIDWKDRYFVHQADLATNPSAAYRVTDLAGNARTIRPDVVVQSAPERIPTSSQVAVASAEGEATVELSGTAGSRKVTLLLPGLTEADFAAAATVDLAADPTIPPERFAIRLLLSGALALKGQVTIPGQARSVSISYDGGATYLSLASVKEAKSAKPTLSFSLSVEASKIQAGSSRWLLKIDDFSGSVFYCPIYGYADNIAPAVSVIYPDSASLAQTGPFPLVIRAEDAEGLAMSEVSIGSAKNTVDPASFNRFLAMDLDLWEESKGAPLAIAAIFKDAAGNQASASQKVSLNAPGDLPTVAFGATENLLERGSVLYGRAADDDAVPEISVSIDDGETESFAAGSFAVQLPELATGKHALVVTATGPDGKISQAKKEFTFKAAKPSIGDLAVGDASSTQPYRPGIEIPLTPAQSLSFTIVAPNGIGSVEYSINGGPFAKAVAGKTASGKAPVPGESVPYSFPIPQSLAFGRFTVDLVAKCSLGLEEKSALEFHAVLPAQAGTDADDAIRFEHERITRTEEGFAFELKPGESLVGLFNGRPIRSVSLSPASESLDLAFDGPSITLTARADDLLPPSSIVLETVDGDRFEWGPFVAKIDALPPALALDSPTDHEWLTNTVLITGSASDANGIVSVEVSVNGGPRISILEEQGATEPETSEPPPEPATSTPVEEAPAAEAPAPASEPPAETAPEVTAPVESAPAEPAPVSEPSVEAAPAEPAPAEPAPADLTLFDDPSIRQIAYVLTPALAEEIGSASAKKDVNFNYVLPLPTAPDGATRIEIIARDAAGHETREIRYINKDTLQPEVVMVIPAPGDSVNGTMTIIGEARDGGRLDSIIYMPGFGAPAEEVNGRSSFSRTFDFARTEWPLPEAAGFLVTDKAGNGSIMAPDLVVDTEKDKPIAEIHAPSEMEVLRSNFTISGVAYDDDGLSAAYFRIDWSDWQRIEMQGTSFTLPIILKETTDNEHLVEVRAEDIYGVQGDIVSRRYRISKE